MNALDTLRHHRVKEQAHKELGRRLAAERKDLIAAAFADGHTGPEIASAAGCSRERVYQIRDGR